MSEICKQCRKSGIAKMCKSASGECEHYHPELEIDRLRIANEILRAKLKASTEKLEQGWIPVSERLPEKYGCYLVAWRPTGVEADGVKQLTKSDLTHYYEILEFDPEDESGWISSIEQCKEYILLAWCKLPKPYKEVTK